MGTLLEPPFRSAGQFHIVSDLHIVLDLLIVSYCIVSDLHIIVSYLHIVLDLLIVSETHNIVVVNHSYPNNIEVLYSKSTLTILLR